MIKEKIPTDAVEKQLCEPMDNTYATYPLTKDQFPIFLNMMGIDDEEAKEHYNKLIESGAFLLSLISERIKCLNYEIDEKTKMMLSCITDRPGTAVMYVYYLAYKAKKLNKKKITFDDFIEIFPMGYFTEKQLDELWDGQKLNGHNLVDIEEASVSLLQ